MKVNFKKHYDLLPYIYRTDFRQDFKEILSFKNDFSFYQIKNGKTSINKAEFEAIIALFKKYGIETNIDVL